MGKADDQNNPASKSCLLRVPYTFNSKCPYDKADPEVKIVRSFSDTQTLPNIDNLLIEFQTFLIDNKLKSDSHSKNKVKLKNRINIECNTIHYIEKLSISIADHRNLRYRSSPWRHIL
jgi:hypothetical protein